MFDERRLRIAIPSASGAWSVTKLRADGVGWSLTKPPGSFYGTAKFGISRPRN
jgi:hypothetical protein